MAIRPLRLAFHAGRLYFFDGLMPIWAVLRCGLDWEADLMSSEQKVAIVTGASQGIGASLVKAYRDMGYGVVANSRSIKASDFSDDPAIAAVAGDIASRETAERIWDW